MKEFFRFFLKALPMAIGLILCLTSLTYLVEFSVSGYHAEENFLAFAFIAVVGIPTLLYGIRKLSSDGALQPLAEGRHP